MKSLTPLLLRSLEALALFLILLAGPSPAQDLPRAVLELPPLPTMAAAPVLSLPAGLPGGPPTVYVPISHLTLPEKPSLPAPSPALHPENDSLPTSDSAPSPEDPSLVPADLLQPTQTPLLPGLPLPDEPSPDFLPDPLPSPGDPTTPGFIEIQSPPEETSAAAPTGPGPSGSTSDPDPVSPSDLAPAPDSSADATNPSARGPIFRIKGAAAITHTRPLGYRFTPAMGQGRRDGIHTVASQVPNLLTSEVHGPRMMQLRPSPLWTTPYIENTFYMFCDSAYNAVRLQPGWKIRGIQLKGPHWQWVVCPKSGANTASFSVRLRAWKTIDTPTQGTVVTLEGLTLEGPPGATDWKAAFPSLLRPAPLAARR